MNEHRNQESACLHLRKADLNWGGEGGGVCLKKGEAAEVRSMSLNNETKRCVVLKNKDRVNQ